MPNNCQPQGLTKTVISPVQNEFGQFFVDFDMPEDDGIATASHLVLRLDDGVTRDIIHIMFVTSLLRTRFDTVDVSIESSTATKLRFYIANDASHIDTYRKLCRPTLETPTIDIDIYPGGQAFAKKLITITKRNDVVLLNHDGQCERVALYPAPEDGSTTSTP